MLRSGYPYYLECQQPHAEGSPTHVTGTKSPNNLAQGETIAKIFGVVIHLITID